MPSPANLISATVSPEEIREELARIVGSLGFVNSERMCRFLRTAVEWTLLGRTNELKENGLGRLVFDRPADFDPKNDSIVRVEAQRLRRKLRQYYESAGRENPLRISLEPGSYIPTFGRHIAEPNVAGVAGLDACVIAVFPFANLGREEDLDHICEGVQEAIIQELTRVPGLRVLGYSSIAAGMRKHATPADLCIELGSGTRVEGSLSQSGDLLRLTATVLDCRTGHPLWAGCLERPRTELAGMQDEMAASLASSLQSLFGLPTQAHIPRAAPPTTEAYTLYLRARHAWSLMTPAGLRAAQDGFTALVETYPDYAAPYAGLADIYIWLMMYSLARPREVATKARRAALEALRLDSTLAEPYITLGIVLFTQDRQWARADQMFHRATEANPNYSMAWSYYAWLLAGAGRLEECLQAFHRAHEIDPLEARTKRGLAMGSYLNRQYAAAEAWSEAALTMTPGMPGSRTIMILAQLAAGKNRAALESARQVQPEGSIPLEYAAAAAAFARNGEIQRAARMLQHLEETSSLQYTDAMAMAVACAGLRDSEGTLRYLTEACDERSPMAMWFPVIPLFDPYREVPAFRSLVASLNLP